MNATTFGLSKKSMHRQCSVFEAEASVTVEIHLLGMKTTMMDLIF